MDYVKLAAGGSFKENLVRGPLAAMHARLRELLQAGIRSAEFRAVDATDVYRLLKAALLIRLVFPDDTLLLRPPASREVRDTKRWIREIAARHLAPRRSTAIEAAVQVAARARPDAPEGAKTLMRRRDGRSATHRSPPPCSRLTSLIAVARFRRRLMQLTSRMTSGSRLPRPLFKGALHKWLVLLL